MEREAFRQRMQQYKQARENNPQLKYWDWKKENDLGYQLYKNNLPSNLQVETDDYDLYGAYESNMQPELNEDGTYHLGSRDPYTGRILKSKQHPTYQKAIESEISAGYFPYEKNNITYTKTYSPVDISGYADGGIIDEDPPQSTSERPITNFDPKGDPYNPTYKLYDDAIESRNRIIEDLYSNPAYMERARQIKKAIRSLPKDMRSIEAAYLQFATPGQYTKWFNKIPLLGTYPIVNKQFQNYEEDKDKAREQR